MEITWLGHASVCINSRDVLLITDPYDSSEGTFMSPRKADIVVSTNLDSKHSNTSAVSGSPRLIQGPGEYEVSHFYITGTGTAASEEEGLGAQVNTVYTIRVEGLVVSHLGALNKKPPAAQMEALRQTEILIAPISGEGSLSKSDLQEMVSAIQPRILIPVQHGSGGPEGLSEPQGLLTDMGLTEIPDPAPRLNVTETNLPAEMQVQMLRRSA
jgi:L-ascorbate metabolism protein UlaG (beta-lactamase superfamily)